MKKIGDFSTTKEEISDLNIKRKSKSDKIIALAGNPNVGKSTIFNALTGMKQHTGNWPGKTVSNAQGYCLGKDNNYILIDLPGTYSIMANSVEEEVARNFICFGNPDATIVVCDATCLERNLNLVLQILEISSNVIVCVNLMDEAKRKGIKINLNNISNILGIPVIGTTARKKKSIRNIIDVLDNFEKIDKIKNSITYSEEIEKAILILEPTLKEVINNKINTRWLAIKLLEMDDILIKETSEYLNIDILKNKKINKKINEAINFLEEKNINNEKLKEEIVSNIVKTSEKICKENITFLKEKYDDFDRNIDKILTNKLIGYPIMILLISLIFWLTISGANYPSSILAKGLFWIQDRLSDLFVYFNAPDWLHDSIVLGIYRVLAWVVSVMLPPMAIFFPLFTILEDVGYLPRIAYNLDKPFKKCSACGKQALTMCMGFGCNAVGVMGCRIIDSPRERILAILTNNFVPCNGRFPILITIISMFFITSFTGVFSSVISTVLLTLVVLLGILITFMVTKILSKTILKGVPSAFTLELPPYRKPEFGKILLRSIFDRTLFVLGRAVVVAAPVGLVIWIMANINIGDASILLHVSNFLDPFASIMGLDGIILLAFILGFPANEIVIPIIIMGYMSTGSLIEIDDIWEIKQLFLNNGWTWITAISTMLFSLMHWPCSTTLITIKKETGSLKWTILAAIIPTIVGIISCIVFSNIAKIFI